MFRYNINGVKGYFSMNEKQKQLGEEKIGKLLMKFSLPAVAGMLIGALYNIIDRMFIGKAVGSYAIAGVGLAFPVMAIILAFGLLFGIGGSTLISIRLGEKKHNEAEKILGNIFVLLIILGIFITIVGTYLLDPLLNLLGAGEQTFLYAKKYMSVILSGSIFAMMAYGMNHSIRSDGNPKVAMMSSFVGAITNIVLDYVFIMRFGWGIKGGAYATIIGQAFTAIWVIYYFTKGAGHIKLRIKYFKLDLYTIKDVSAIGISSFLIQFTASISGTFANRALRATGGELAIGAMTIIMSTVMLFFMPIIGLRQGAQPIIGFNFGAKEFERVKQTFWLGTIVSTAASALAFILIQVFPQFFILLFTKNKEVMGLGMVGMRVIILMLATVGFQIMVTTFFQAIGDSKMALFLSVLRQAILLIPLLLILPRFLGIMGVWISYPIADGIAFLVCLYLVRKRMHAVLV